MVSHFRIRFAHSQLYILVINTFRNRGVATTGFPTGDYPSCRPLYIPGRSILSSSYAFIVTFLIIHYSRVLLTI